VRRRIVIAAGIAVAACRHPHPPPCTDPAQALAGVWDRAIEVKVRAAFAATKKAYAESATMAVTKALDGYFADWVSETAGNCKAIEGGQIAQDAGARRQLCLDQRFEEGRALAEMLLDPTAALVDKADKAVWELDPVVSCADPGALVPSRVEPRYQADYRRLLLQTATAHAQAVGGQLVAAEGALMHAADEGRRIHADDVVAVALYARSAVLFGEGRLDESYALASDAVWAALLAHRDDLVIGSALTVASARAEGGIADGWVGVATAAATRSGGFSPLYDEQRLELIGVIAGQRGDLKTAIASHEQALAAANGLWGSEGAQVWSAEVQLATTLARSGAWVKALPHFEHALRLREAAVGPDHPDVALILSNLAPCYAHAGQRDVAMATVKRAFEIREKSYGPNSPFLVATLDNLADFELHQGAYTAALADIDRAEAIARRVPGTADPNYHIVATTRAEVLGAAGRVADARKAFDDLLALEAQTKSPQLGLTLAARATLELAQKQWKDAAAFEDRAIAAYGPDDLSLWKPLAGLAQARHALDPNADVKPLLERALAIGIKAQLAPDDLDPIRAQLAGL